MDHENAQLNLPLLAVDALDRRDAEELTAHLQECEQCRRDLAAYQSLAGALRVEPVEPDRSGLESLREQFRARLESDRPQAGSGLASSLRRARWRQLGGVAAILVALGGWTTAYEFHQTAGRESRVLALMAEGTHVPLTARDSQYRAVLSVKQDVAVVWAESLPKLPPGHLYEGWWIVSGRPIRAGVFSQGPTVLNVPSSHPVEFAVTIEPAKGTSQPTTPVLVAGSLPI